MSVEAARLKIISFYASFNTIFCLSKNTVNWALIRLASLQKQLFSNTHAQANFFHFLLFLSLIQATDFLPI